MPADPATAARRSEDLPPTAARRLSNWLKNYRTFAGIPDELFDRHGTPREYWLRFLGDISEYPEQEFDNRFSVATRHIRDTGVSYRIYGEENERSWPINPLPLILGEGEWAQIAAGVEHHRKRIAAEGAVREDVAGDVTPLHAEPPVRHGRDMPRDTPSTKVLRRLL